MTNHSHFLPMTNQRLHRVLQCPIIEALYHLLREEMLRLLRPSVTIFMMLILAGYLSAQRVGIETTSPDSTLSIQNKLEIGGTHGDVLFTDDLGSITFPSTTTPNTPMIHLFDTEIGGPTNALRMVMAHSTGQPNVGISYNDTTDYFRFGQLGIDKGVYIDALHGRLAVGTGDIEGITSATLFVSSGNESFSNTSFSTGYFANTKTSNVDLRRALVGSASGSGTAPKIGGYFESLAGQGRNFGVQGYAAFADTTIGVYGSTGDQDSMLYPGIHRAAWFDIGEVVVDQQLLIGSSALSDKTDPSALVELNSTTRGFLLPRMTTAQRLAIASPAEALVVYDMTASAPHYFDGSGWQNLAGGGGGGGEWIPDGNGIHYDAGSIGIGKSSVGYIAVDLVDNGSQLGLNIYSSYSGGGNKIGLQSIVDSEGTGPRYGVFGLAVAPLSGSASTYGVYGDVSQGSSSSSPVYGIYGNAGGTGSGDRWSGFFNNGAVRVNDQMVVGDVTPGMPHTTAVLELQSTDQGFLPPRMTTAQRTAIGSPAEGLVVYDNGANALYLHNGSAWEEVGAGTGGGDSPWTENAIGIHYDGANVVVGDNQESFFEQFYTYTDSKQYSGRFDNEYASNLSKYGVYGSVSHHGTGTRIGVYGVANASSTGTSDTYGVRGEVSASGASDVYAVYGNAYGSTTGVMWAGYFNGEVGITDHLKIITGEDASLTLDGYLQTGETTGLNLILDNNEILARDNGLGSPMYLQRDAGDLMLCALEQGQVAIGIENPANLPSNEYLLAVDGKGIFEAVRVELSGVWPDYVFAPEYRLKPLGTLEQEIKTQGHLPGIPSATTVAKEGIDVGEMQGKMLEKIEELTLYIIAQQKEIDALREQVYVLQTTSNGK
jgi:hypothetical protein